MKKILTSKRKRKMVVRIYCFKKREGKVIHTIGKPNINVCISNYYIRLSKLTGRFCLTAVLGGSCHCEIDILFYNIARGIYYIIYFVKRLIVFEPNE